MKISNSAWAGMLTRCPHCGCEYHMAEIFMPDDVTGRVRNAIKDPLGKMIYVEYEDDGEPCLTQRYCCDQCGMDFVAEAIVSIKSRPVAEEADFSEEYASLL